MRQAASQLAYGLHFLRLAQLFLGLHQFRRALGDPLFERLIERTKLSNRFVTLRLDCPPILNIYEYPWKVERSAVRAVIDTAIGFNPVIIPIARLTRY